MTEEMNGDQFYTVPELAKHLGINAQTVRRYIKKGLLPFTRNADGWPMIRLQDVPKALLERTKKLSSARYRPAAAQRSDAETSADRAAAELAFYRNQLARALTIIERLTGGPGDHPLDTFPEP
jgi:excisionase family DNA binding protein